MRKRKRHSYNNENEYKKNEAFERGEIKGVNINAVDEPGDLLLDDYFDTSEIYNEPEISGNNSSDKPPNIEAAILNVEDIAYIEESDTDDTTNPHELIDETEISIEKRNLLPSLEDNETESGESNRTSFYKRNSSGSISLSNSLFMKIYDAFYVLGIQSFRYGKLIFSWLGRLAIKPLRYIYTLSRIFVIAVDRLFFRSIHAVHEEAVYFRKEIKSSSVYLRRAFKKDPFSAFSIFYHYVKKALTSHKDMFKTIANLSMPIAALIVFWLTINYWNSVTYALKVTYSDRSIGYIQDESVYISAQALANERLGANSSDNNAASVELDKPTYKLALVKLNQLNDDSAICDSLIDYSKANITNACGIYIDGEFIGAVKNETDAAAVFDNILAQSKTNDTNTIVAFVEDVKYAQGLYPDNTTMLDAGELTEKLNTKKKEAEYCVVKDGETIWDIAMRNGLTESDLLAMNPQAGDGTNIHPGDAIKVSNYVNFVRVKLIKTEVRYVDIAYDTVKTDNASLFRGDTRTVRKGVSGKESVKEFVTYIDGMRISAQEIERTRIADPIAEKVEVGTKSTTIYSQSGSYSVSVSREGFVWPVPGCHSVSSPFGYRSRGYHNGVDIAGAGTNGKIIAAAKDGVVESVERSNSSYGNYVVINHGGGIRTGYGHCLKGSISVSVGQHVSAGQAIARVGATGNATGPHLHFNLIINGTYVNPMPYIS